MTYITVKEFIDKKDQGILVENTPINSEIVWAYTKSIGFRNYRDDSNEAYVENTYRYINILSNCVHYGAGTPTHRLIIGVLKKKTKEQK